MPKLNQPRIALLILLALAGFAQISASNHPASANSSGGGSRQAGLPPALPTPPSTIPIPTPLPSAQPTDCSDPFVDINGNVFYHAIHYMYCAGDVNGVDSTHFNPGGLSTRAQFAKVVVLAFVVPSATTTSQTFSDVPVSYFAYDYIEAGVAAGILGGYSAAGCRDAGAIYPCYLPNRPITRAETARLVSSAAHYQLITPPTPTFVDVPPSYFAYAFIETAHAHGIIQGRDSTHFAPNAIIRRDETCAIIYAASGG